MNKYGFSKVALIVLFPVLIAQTVNAEECASVSFVSNEIAGKEVILELLGSNGKALPQPKKYQKTLKGDYEYLLAPGTHTLIVNQWNKRDFSSYNKNLRKGRTISNPPKPLQSTVTMQILADQHYQVTVSEIELGSVIEVKHQKNKVCEGKHIAKAKVTSPKLLATELPVSIEKQLTSIMTNITAFHHKTSDNRDDKNVQPRKLNRYFGTVLAKGFSGDGMRVNNVIKNSLADKVNIQTGDVITKLGSEKLNFGSNNPGQVINEYLKARVYGEEIMVEVLRNGKTLELVGNYIPVVVPEVTYSVTTNEESDVINQTFLTEQLTFDFDQLLLAINNHYQNMGQGNKAIIVKRPTFELEINLASVGIAQQTMLAESQKRSFTFDKMRSKNIRSSGFINGNLERRNGSFNNNAMIY
jgi:hypothetical protein